MGQSEEPLTNRPTSLKQTTYLSYPLVLTKYAKLGGMDKNVGLNIQKAKAKGFETNRKSQVDVLHFCSEVWKYLTPKAQGELRKHLLPTVPRIRSGRFPKRTFERFVTLPERKDIQRALNVGVEVPMVWTPEPDEMMYPTDGFIGQYLKYAKHNQSNLAFHFWALVSVVGAMCHRKYYVDTGQFIVYLHNYIILTGDSDSGKSTAASVARDLMARFNRQMREKNPTLDQDHPDSIYLLPNDTTPEGIVWELSQRHVSRVDPETKMEVEGKTDACAMLVVDEIANLFSKDNWAPSKTVSLLTQLWSDYYYKKGTKSGGHEEVNNAALSMLALGAPTWFQGGITDEFRNGGLLDRTIFIHRQKTNRIYSSTELPPFDPLVAEALASEMVPWATRGEVEMLPDKPAKEWEKEWYHGVSKRMKREAEGSIRKRSLNRQGMLVWKLATVLAITYGEVPVVSDVRLEQAANILKAEEESLNKLFAVVDEGHRGPIYKDIEAFIYRKGGCVPRGKLMQQFRNRKGVGTSRALEPLLETLIHDGTLEKIQGKPEVYRRVGHEECRQCEPMLASVKRIA